MARRRKSKDEALVEAIGGLAGVGVILWFFSPTFRNILATSLIGLAFLILFILAIWLAYKIFKPQRRVTYYDTFLARPRPSPHILTPIIESSPLTIADEIEPYRVIPELSLSEQLRKIDWFQFEKLIEIIYRHRGYEVQRLGGAKPDGGVDLIVESVGEKFVVQCKQWKKWQVGVRNIREFMGTMTDSQISKGIFITLSGYSGEAKQLATKHGINILNQSDVIQMLEETGLKDSHEVAELLSDSSKFCPKCDSKLILRKAKATGNQFWGCSTYPRCTFKMKFDETC